MCPPTPWMPYNDIYWQRYQEVFAVDIFKPQLFPNLRVLKTGMEQRRKKISQFRKCNGVFMRYCLSSYSFPRGHADTCWILLCSPFTYTAPTWDFCWKSVTLEIVTGSFRPAAVFPASSIFIYKTIWSTETEIFPQCSLCGITWKKCSRISTSAEHHYSNEEDILSRT